MPPATARHPGTPRAAPDDAALVARAAEGDHAAFASLYRAHADPVHGLLTRLVGPRPEREDLLQEVFVRFHRALPGFRLEAQVATFLHGIAVRVAWDHLRARRRRPALVSPDDDGEPGASDAPSPEQDLARRDEVARVLAFLDRLKPEQRVAFVLREVLELSYPEVAALMGCFTTTARMRVAAATRALARFRSEDRRSP